MGKFKQKTTWAGIVLVAMSIVNLILTPDVKKEDSISQIVTGIGLIVAADSKKEN